jgi:hypothetical protein
MTIRGSQGHVAVYLERGRRQVLAGAADWPGWCGYGSGEGEALAALLSCAPRYALIAGTADFPFPCLPLDAGAFLVTEQLAGSSAADRGAPGLIPACDTRPADAPTAQRWANLLTAAWAVFYQVSGGRCTSRLVDHVIEADVASARKLGIRRRRPSIRDTAALVGLREEITSVVGRPSDGTPVIARGWPARYAARQIAWHVIDHIWQIEDSRLPPLARRGMSGWRHAEICHHGRAGQRQGHPGHHARARP